MEEEPWTERQLIEYVQAQGFPRFCERQLRRYRDNNIMRVEVEHTSFGGTRSWYPASAAASAGRAVCILQRNRNFDQVRWILWLEGYHLEWEVVRKGIWDLFPFADWDVSHTLSKRQRFAKRLTEKAIKSAWEKVRTNGLRKFLQTFQHQADQSWFLHLQAQMLYGVPVDFQRNPLNKELQEALAEPADVMKKGLGDLPFLPHDMAPSLQQMADEQILSIEAWRSALFSASESAATLARQRLRLFLVTFDTLQQIGYGGRRFKIYATFVRSPHVQALVFILLLLLEEREFQQNIAAGCAAIEYLLKHLKLAQALREILTKELPAIARQIPSLATHLRIISQGSKQKQEAALAHMQILYENHQKELATFFLVHPELLP
jgi:hypothetical protein